MACWAVSIHSLWLVLLGLTALWLVKDVLFLRRATTEPRSESTHLEQFGSLAPEDVPFDQRITPVQFEFELCHGFAEQRFQLIDGLLVGLLLGAQVVLPERMVLNGAHDGTSDSVESIRPLSEFYDMERLIQAVQHIYTKYWCARRGYLAPWLIFRDVITFRALSGPPG